MNPFKFPFQLPFLPLRGTLRLAKTIQEEADRQLADPATVRRELEDVEQAQAAGQISDTEAAELEDKTVAEYTQVRRGTAATADSDEG
jgi:Gas vesicle protein G